MTNVVLEYNIAEYPLADLAALKAIDTTLRNDGVTYVVKSLGFFRLDKTSSETSDDRDIIAPTVGTGRFKRLALAFMPTTSAGKIDPSVLPWSTPLQFKGEINVAADFPTIASVQDGWAYFTQAAVTDNDPTKTNTGQSFAAKQYIVWKTGTPNKWINVSGSDLWIDTGTVAQLITARPIDAQSQKVLNIAAGTNGTDAVNLTQVSDAIRMPKFQSYATIESSTTYVNNLAPRIIEFTGTASQSLVLPDATTLTAGFSFLVVNKSTGSITVKNFSETLLFTINYNQSFEFVCADISTSNGVWDILNTALNVEFPLNYNSTTGLLGTKASIHTGVSGLISITINADPTKFDVGAGSGIVVDNSNPNAPVYTPVSWTAKTAQTTPYLTLAAGTWLGINASGNVVTKDVDFTSDELRTIMRIGRLSHFGRTVITATYQYPLMYYGDIDYAYFGTAIGTINLKDNVFSENGANLKLNKSPGVSYRVGANALVNIANPNHPTSPSATQIPFLRSYINASGGSTIEGSFTDINPTQWDNKTGTLQTVPAGSYTTQAIVYFPNGTLNTTFVLYGQVVYSTFTLARNSLPVYNPVIPSDLAGGCIRGYIIVRDDVTNLTAAIAAGTALIVDGVMFGEKAGSGGGGGGGGSDWQRTLISGSNYLLSPVNAGDTLNITATDAALTEISTFYNSSAANGTEYFLRFGKSPAQSMYFGFIPSATTNLNKGVLGYSSVTPCLYLHYDASVEFVGLLKDSYCTAGVGLGGTGATALTTTAQNIIGAINELNSEIPSGDHWQLSNGFISPVTAANNVLLGAIGAVSSYITASTTRLEVHGYGNSFGSTKWIGACISGAQEGCQSDTLVLGVINGWACVGAHRYDLGAWRDIVLGGVGKVGIGFFAQKAVDLYVTSMVGVGGVVTMVTSQYHQLVAGQTFVVAGAVPSGLNGTQTVDSVTDNNTLVFLSGTYTGTATGTITATPYYSGSEIIKAELDLRGSQYITGGITFSSGAVSHLIFNERSLVSTVSSFSIVAQGGILGGTDKNAGVFTLAGGQSTGAGISPILMSTCLVGASGITDNAYLDAFSICYPLTSNGTARYNFKGAGTDALNRCALEYVSDDQSAYPVAGQYYTALHNIIDVYDGYVNGSTVYSSFTDSVNGIVAGIEKKSSSFSLFCNSANLIAGADASVNSRLYLAKNKSSLLFNAVPLEFSGVTNNITIFEDSGLLKVVFNDLPTSPAGLVFGQLYKLSDGAGNYNLKVVGP